MKLQTKASKDISAMQKFAVIFLDFHFLSQLLGSVTPVPNQFCRRRT